MECNLIESIDIYGNHYFQFRDKQNYKYIVYSDQLPDELKILGQPIKDDKIIQRQKILAAYNIFSILNMKEYKLSHDQLKVEKLLDIFKNPFIPTSLISFKNTKFYQNHISIIERIKEGQNSGVVNHKIDHLRIYQQIPENNQIVTECVCQNLLDIIDQIKQIRGSYQQFQRDFSHLVEEMYKKMLRLIGRLIYDYQIYQPDISFNNIIITNEGKWQFLSYASAIQIGNKKKTNFYHLRKEFLHPKYYKIQQGSQQQFYDLSVKSLGLLVLNMILMAYDYHQAPEAIDYDLFSRFFNEIRIQSLVQNELLELLMILFKKEIIQRDDHQISLYNIDEHYVIKIYNFTDPYIKLFQENFKYFQDDIRSDYKKQQEEKKDKSKSITKEDLQKSLLSKKILELDDKKKSYIFQNFQTIVSKHQSHINSLQKIEANNVFENTIKKTDERMKRKKQNARELKKQKVLIDNNIQLMLYKLKRNQKQQVNSIKDQFIKRFEVKNHIKTEECLPEIFIPVNQQLKKTYNYTRNDRLLVEQASIINIEESDYLLASAILKYNQNIQHTQIKLSNQILIEEDGAIFKAILNGFTQNNVIRHFQCNLKGLQFTENQFQDLLDALLNNKSCQIYELELDNTNLKTDQIVMLKQKLNERSATESIFISYSETSFMSDYQQRETPILNIESGFSIYEPLRQQQEYVEQGGIVDLQFLENPQDQQEEINYLHKKNEQTDTSIEISKLTESQQQYANSIQQNQLQDVTHHKNHKKQKQDSSNVTSQNDQSINQYQSPIQNGSNQKVQTNQPIPNSNPQAPNIKQKPENLQDGSFSQQVGQNQIDQQQENVKVQDSFDKKSNVIQIQDQYLPLEDKTSFNQFKESTQHQSSSYIKENQLAEISYDNNIPKEEIYTDKKGEEVEVSILITQSTVQNINQTIEIQGKDSHIDNNNNNNNDKNNNESNLQNNNNQSDIENIYFEPASTIANKNFKMGIQQVEEKYEEFNQNEQVTNGQELQDQHYSKNKQKEELNFDNPISVTMETTQTKNQVLSSNNQLQQKNNMQIRNQQDENNMIFDEQTTQENHNLGEKPKQQILFDHQLENQDRENKNYDNQQSQDNYDILKYKQNKLNEHLQQQISITQETNSQQIYSQVRKDEQKEQQKQQIQEEHQKEVQDEKDNQNKNVFTDKNSEQCLQKLKKCNQDDNIAKNLSIIRETILTQGELDENFSHQSQIFDEPKNIYQQNEQGNIAGNENYYEEQIDQDNVGIEQNNLNEQEGSIIKYNELIEKTNCQQFNDITISSTQNNPKLKKIQNNNQQNNDNFGMNNQQSQIQYQTDLQQNDIYTNKESSDKIKKSEDQNKCNLDFGQQSQIPVVEESNTKTQFQDILGKIEGHQQSPNNNDCIEKELSQIIENQIENQQELCKTITTDNLEQRDCFDQQSIFQNENDNPYQADYQGEEPDYTEEKIQLRSDQYDD